MHEMIYTSAPSTLEAPGLGAVAITSGIPRNVEGSMRRLSRFDFFELPGDQLTPPRFAVFSHVVVKDGGSNWHICTRTVSTGFDYTERPNFLAHHLAFTDDELPPGRSVFDVWETSDLFADQWDSEPKTINPRPLTLSPATKRLNAWPVLPVGKDGGLQLVQWRIANQKAFLLDDSPLQILGLFKEAALSLGVQQANQVAFTTALGADVQGISFDWIGIIRGTKFAATVQAAAPEKVIDTQCKLESVERAKPGQVVADKSAPTIEKSTQFEEVFFDKYVASSQRNVLPRSLPPAVPNEALNEMPPPPPLPNQLEKFPLVFCAATGVLFLIAVALAAYTAMQWKTALVLLSSQQKELQEVKQLSEKTQTEITNHARQTEDLRKEKTALLQKLEDEFAAGERRGKMKAEDAARRSLETLQRRIDALKEIQTAPEEKNSDSPEPAAATESPRVIDRIACIDPDSFQRNGHVQFNLDGQFASIKSASLLTHDCETLNVPVVNRTLALQVGSHVLEITFEAPASDRPASTPATNDTAAALTSALLTLRESKAGDDFTKLPMGTSIRVELVTATSGTLSDAAQSSELLYIVFHPLLSSIIHVEPSDETQQFSPEQLRGFWTRFIGTKSAGRLMGTDLSPASSIEGLEWVSERLQLPALWPHNRELIDQFESSSALSATTCRRDGYDIGIIRPVGTFPLELRVVKVKTELLFACSFSNSPNRKSWLPVLDKSVKLTGRIERRAKDKSSYPLIFFGAETDFRSFKFLKTANVRTQSDAISGGTNE